MKGINPTKRREFVSGLAGLAALGVGQPAIGGADAFGSDGSITIGMSGPYESRRASELLSRLVFHNVSASERLHVLDHSIACTPDLRLEEACYEVLRTPFLMPVEGGESAIQTIDRIDMQPDGLHFSLNETYAAYLRFSGNCHDALRRAMTVEVDAPKPLPLDQAHRSIVVTALQSLHRDRTTTWNCHAIYALENAQCVQPPAAFGLAELEWTLSKLEASTAP